MAQDLYIARNVITFTTIPGAITEERMHDINYVISLLELPIKYICSKDELFSSENNIDVLLISDDNTKLEDLQVANFKHVVLPIKLKDTIDNLHLVSHVHYTYMKNIAEALLLILKIVITNHKYNQDDLAVAKLTLIEMFENHKNDFIEKSRQKELEEDPSNVFINSTALYLAGKATDFRDEFAITDSGKTEIVYDLKRFHFLQLDKLRFDPHNDECMVFNCIFYLEYSDGEKVALDDYYTNASFISDGRLYFLGAPNIVFKPFDRINPLYLHCSFSISSLENTKYFRKLSTVKAIKKHYQALLEKGYLRGFSTRYIVDQSVNQLNSKKVYFLLGPKGIGLDRINNYLLDHTGLLIKQKIFYPTHQREFFNKIGGGSIYSLFSRKTEKVVIFDEHKAKFLKKDLLTGKFEKLLLVSEEFLVGDRLFDCIKTFSEAKCIYYLCDNIDIMFEKYKSEIFFKKGLIKFQDYVLTGGFQVKYIFTLLKCLFPEQLILKKFSNDYYNNPDKLFDTVLDEPFSIASNYNYPFNLRKISNIALEFKRLINFYTIIDDRIDNFLKQALLEYSGGCNNYLWLSPEEYETNAQLLTRKLEIIFSTFNYQNGLEELKSMKPQNDKVFLEQALTKNQLEEIVSFLKKKDDDMYIRLIIELKLSRDIITDSKIFDEFIAGI